MIDLDSAPIQYTADFKQNEESANDPELSRQGSTNSTQSPSKTSFTTANGDGLTFDPFTLNIFDEVQMIIEGRDEQMGNDQQEVKEKSDDPFDVSNLKYDGDAN